LALHEAPLRIECFDISNLQGTEIVGSMVVMEDGLAKRSDYRRFKVRSQESQDDFAAMEEVLTRRFRRYLQERDEGARKGKRFAITYHRQLRQKKMTKSALDEVSGLGPTRRTRLLKEFGSVKKLRERSLDELLAVPWLPDQVARDLYERLHGGAATMDSRNG